MDTHFITKKFRDLTAQWFFFYYITYIYTVYIEYKTRHPVATNKGYLFIFCLYKNYDESVRDCLPKHFNKFGKNDLKNYSENKSELYSIGLAVSLYY